MSVNKYDATTDTLTKVAGNATVPIDDTVASTDKVYSSSKVEEISRNVPIYTDLESFIDTTKSNVKFFGVHNNDLDYGGPTTRMCFGKAQVQIVGVVTRCIQTVEVSTFDEKVSMYTRTGVHNNDTWYWSDWQQLATTDAEFLSKSITDISQAIPSTQFGYSVYYGENITGKPTGTSSWGIVRSYRYGATTVMYYEDTSDNLYSYKGVFNSEDGVVRKAWSQIY